MRIPSLKALTMIAGWMAAQGGNSQSLDPVKDYCFRFDHQSVIKNDTLYIYMGKQTFADSVGVNGQTNSTITVGYNEYMITVDLILLGLGLAKSAFSIAANPTTGSQPPQVVRGTMYHGPQGDDGIYLYGGTTSYVNTSFSGWQPPTPSTYTLWSYDTKSRQWTHYNVEQSAPYRPSNGAAAEAIDQGLAFYFNGELNSGSSQGINIMNLTSIFVSGMIVVNTTDQTARNLSTAQVSIDQARARGRMQYIPGIGEKGILVLIGGSTYPANQLKNIDSDNFSPMTEINIFDVASIYNSSTPDGVWYQQNATNHITTEVPSPRVDFCLALASAQDSSSHNIYMFGGQDESKTYLREVWLLSLPSFTWIKVNAAEPPRIGHTCHLVGNRTMLTVGGIVDIRESTGLLELCDFAAGGINELDMSDLLWNGGFNATTPAYEVPDLLSSTIGGSRTGGATMRMPPANFSSVGLARLFSADPDDEPESPPDVPHDEPETPPDVPHDEPETPPHAPHSETAIVVGAVCGVVILALLVALRRYAASWWGGKTRNHPETEQPPHEIEGVSLGGHVWGRVVDPVELHGQSASEPTI